MLILFCAACCAENLLRFLLAGKTCSSIVYGIYVHVYAAETTGDTSSSDALLVNIQYRGNPQACHMAFRSMFRQKKT